MANMTFAERAAYSKKAMDVLVELTRLRLGNPTAQVDTSMMAGSPIVYDLAELLWRRPKLLLDMLAVPSGGVAGPDPRIADVKAIEAKWPGLLAKLVSG